MAFVSGYGGLGSKGSLRKVGKCSRVVLKTSVPAPPIRQGGGKPPRVPNNSWGRGGDGDEDGDGVFIPALLAMWQSYLKALEANPLLVKAISAAVLAAIGDVGAQFLERGSWEDIRRTLALGATAALITAPMFHYCYGFLESRFPSSAGVRNVVIQLAVDQLIAAPLFIPLFLAVVGPLEGKSLKEVQGQIQRDSIPMIKLGWCIYPAVQIFNFSVIPVRLRLLLVNVIDLGFMTMLSYVSHMKGHASEEETLTGTA